MSLFGKGGFWGGLLSNILFDGPSVVDKVDMLLTDVETEGKKQGYDRAAKEYEKAYREIEEEYKETKNLIEEQKIFYGNQSYQYIERLEKLEKQKEELEKQVNLKVNDVSRRYNIPTGDVKRSLATGTLVGGTGIGDALDMIYIYKEMKLRSAEQRGYAEAKELYESKIEKLKVELNRLKNKGDKEIQSLLTQISEILDEISQKQMKIAELKILL